MRKIFAYIGLLLILSVLISPLALSESGTTKTTFGRRQLLSDLQFVPNVAADLTTTDTWIFQLTITTGSSGTTLTINDRATSAKSLLNSVSLAANTTYILTWPEGVKMKNGINWVAGAATTVTIAVVAFQI